MISRQPADQNDMNRRPAVVRCGSDIKAIQGCAEIDVGDHHVGTIGHLGWTERLLWVREFRDLKASILQPLPQGSTHKFVILYEHDLHGGANALELLRVAVTITRYAQEWRNPVMKASEGIVRAGKFAVGRSEFSVGGPGCEVFRI